MTQAWLQSKNEAGWRARDIFSAESGAPHLPAMRSGGEIMRKILTAMLLFVVPMLASAQPPDSLWSRTFGGTSVDECYALQQTADGGYILGGKTLSFGAGDYDVWLVKASECGDSLWSQTYGGTSWDRCASIQQTSDGGYILGGETASFGSGSYDFWLVKTNDIGDQVWSRTYGGDDMDGCESVRQTPDGGYILGGYTRSFGAGGYDFWLVKTDEEGGGLWDRTFGGNGEEGCNSVRQTSDNGYILVGFTYSFGAGLRDFWLVKTNANGDSLWSRTFGGSGQDDCYSVQQTSDGGYILAGYTESFGAGSMDFWLVKTNADGDSLWSRTFGGNDYDWCNSVQQTSDGGYILGGLTGSFGAGFYDSWLVKTNADGDSLWSRTFGGSEVDECFSAQRTADGGYILAGHTFSFGAGGQDFWLVRTGFISPSIVSITDVGNDQGRQARIRWYRSAYDDVCTADHTITGYNIYRRIDEYLFGDRKDGHSGLDWPPGEWEYIMTAPAEGEANYATIVPTLADSTSDGVYWSVFFVRAKTPDPLVHFSSEPDSGYSIDNLPPDVTVMTAMIPEAPGYVRLQWQPVVTGGGGQPEQGDIWYRIYGSTDPMFTPDPGNFLGTTQALEFEHEIGVNDKYFYIIQASDDH
jgi:hypothetical protein